MTTAEQDHFVALALRLGWVYEPTGLPHTFTANGERFTIPANAAADIGRLVGRLSPHFDQPHIETAPVPPGTLVSAQDYELAVQRLSDLFDAKPGSAEEKELHSLAEQIEEYELKHFWPENAKLSGAGDYK